METENLERPIIVKIIMTLGEFVVLADILKNNYSGCGTMDMENNTIRLFHDGRWVATYVPNDCILNCYETIKF